MRRVVTVICAALLFVPVALKSRTGQDVPARTAFRALSSGRISVKVSGDVMHPGIYEVPANSLAAGVINMAVPVSPLKQPLNGPSARPLSDGSAVTLTIKPDGSFLLTAGHMSVPEHLALGIPLDIALMSEADFDRLPGIGPVLARRIVSYRQKNGGILRVSDLKAIDGIGESKYRMLRVHFQRPLNTE
jgi:competence protein ComEA